MAQARGTIPEPYRLDSQTGFLLRRATQRHLAIFAALIPGLTPTQFAALAKLCELGPASQNALGRATAMDGATIKGVIDRLRAKRHVSASRDPGDKRRILLAATARGHAVFARAARAAAAAHQVTSATLKPLGRADRALVTALLTRLG